MKRTSLAAVVWTMALLHVALSYPPAVGVVTKSKSCVSCHANNGQWGDDKTIIDIIDQETMKSLKQLDGTFRIDVKRGERKTVLTVIGRPKNDDAPAPIRTGWIYIDTSRIETNSLTKFAPNWDVNLPMACRLVGDNLKGFERANITALPMTLQPSVDAQDAEVQLQVMITKGESVKGRPREGMLASYFERKVFLRVVE